MLSEKVKNYIASQCWMPLSPDDEIQYRQALKELGISADSIFGEFNLSTYGPTFLSRGYELYNVCWFKLYSDDLDYAITSAEENLSLPPEYLPLDNFETESGFFYNRATGEVLKLDIDELSQKDGYLNLKPQWENFNTFLEWYFEL